MYCINLIFLVAWFYGLKPILRIGFLKDVLVAIRTGKVSIRMFLRHL
jgi:hypothetical protein